MPKKGIPCLNEPNLHQFGARSQEKQYPSVTVFVFFCIPQVFFENTVGTQMWRSILQDYQKRVQEVPAGLSRNLFGVSGEPLPEDDHFGFLFGASKFRPSFSGEDSLAGFVAGIYVKSPYERLLVTGDHRGMFCVSTWVTFFHQWECSVG